MTGEASRRHCECSAGRFFHAGRGLLFIVIFVTMALQGFSAAALNSETQRTAYSEYTVKAAYLYNFAKFVEWPSMVLADPSLPLSICIFGKDPFGDALDTIKDKSVKGRKLVINRYSGVEELTDCHIIFISSSEERNLPRILDKIKGMNVLTVSDMDGFARRGGMINLSRENNKIRLEVNLDAVQLSGLKVSSKLLNIASIIQGQSSER